MAKLLINGHIGKVETDIKNGLDEANTPYFTVADLAVFLSANQHDLEHEVTIRSGGGYVADGMEMYRMLRDSGKKITTISEQSDSIASVIFLAGDVRHVQSKATPLIHFPFIENFFLEHANASILEDAHKQMKTLQNEIVKVYVERTGADASLLSTIMDKNEPISADMFMKLGFANQVITSDIVVNKYRACAKIKEIEDDSILNKTNMNKNEKVKLIGMIDKLKNWLGGAAKNLAVQLADASGEMHVKTEGDMPMVGDEVYLDAEFVTPAAAGEYPIAGGQVVVVAVDENGLATIAEIIEVAAEDVTALKAENEALKAQVQSLTDAKNVAEKSAADAEAKVTAFTEAKAKNEAKNTEIKKELDTLRAMVLDAKNDHVVKKTQAQIDLENRRKFRSNGTT